MAALVERFAELRGLKADDGERLERVATGLCRWVMEHAYPGNGSGIIALELELAENEVRCTVEDWGQPITAFGGGLGEAPAELAEIAAITHDLRLVNLGREGKRLSAAVSAEGVTPVEGTALAQFARESSAGEVTADQIEIRNATPADVEQVSRLLYTNYGLGYGHPNFYRPLWVAGEIEAGRLFSTVATLAGEVVGHHALVLEDADDTTGETGIAVVHPAYRGLGIFNRLFERTLERAREREVQAVYARAVTGHPYSQRAEHSRGYRETALMLGSVPPSTGDDGQPTPRGASLLTFLPLDRSPRAVALPTRYEAAVRAAYENVELEAEDRADPAAAAEVQEMPAVGVERDAQRVSSVVTVSRWGDEGRAGLLEALRGAVHQHDDVVYCDLDLQALSREQLDEAIELLREYDFFYCGLVLSATAGHDHLRLQAMMTDNVELEKIVLDSDYAQELRLTIFGDRGWLPAS